LPQPDFDRETVRVLFEVFRHPVAHRGIASGVWIDRNPNAGGRRLTWQISANSRRPSCEVIPEVGQLTIDPPWPCSFNHRGHIHLRSLRVDIRRAAKSFGRDVAANEQLQANFVKCMRQLYPA
jgi:hypothetical protein